MSDPIVVTSVLFRVFTGGTKEFDLIVMGNGETQMEVFPDGKENGHPRVVSNPGKTMTLRDVLEEAGLAPRLSDAWVTRFDFEAYGYEESDPSTPMGWREEETLPSAVGVSSLTVGDVYARGVMLLQHARMGGTVSWPAAGGAASKASAAMQSATATATAGAAVQQREPVVWEDHLKQPNTYYPRRIPVFDMASMSVEYHWDVDRIRFYADLTKANPKIPFHILMTGPPGGGKSTSCRAVLGGNCRSLSFTETTEEWRAMGKVTYGSDAKGNLQERIVLGELLAAFTHIHDSHCPDPCGGAVFIAEEFNMAPPTILTMIHPMLDGTMRFEYEGVEYIQSPDFLFVGTANLDAPGGMIAPALWSRIKGRIEFEPSTEAARRAGVRDELCDFTDNLIEKRNNGAPRLQIPGMRDLLAADVIWGTLGEASAWQQLLSDAHGSSRGDWLKEIGGSRTSTEFVKFLEEHTTEGRANVI